MLPFPQIWYLHQEVDLIDISVLNQRLIQVPRIAKERNISESVIKDLIQKNEETPFPGIGQPVVNVLKLNIALDGIH